MSSSPRTLRFTIPGTLPGLNEVTLANRANRFVGAKKKRDAQACITPYLPRPIEPMHSCSDVVIVWHEPSNRRDPDNVYSAVKFILDAMVDAGHLLGDSRRYVRDIVHHVRTDRTHPRIEVEVREVVE